MSKIKGIGNFENMRVESVEEVVQQQFEYFKQKIEGKPLPQVYNSLPEESQSLRYLKFCEYWRGLTNDENSCLEEKIFNYLEKFYGNVRVKNQYGNNYCYIDDKWKISLNNSSQVNIEPID